MILSSLSPAAQVPPFLLIVFNLQQVLEIISDDQKDVVFDLSVKQMVTDTRFV